MMAFMNWRMVQAAELLGSKFQVQALSIGGVSLRAHSSGLGNAGNLKMLPRLFFSLLTGAPKPGCEACCAACP